MHDLSRRACQFLLSACTGCVGDSSSLERWQLQSSEVFAEVVPSDMPVVGGTLVGMATAPTRPDLHWTVGRRGLTITAPVHPFEWRDSGSTGVVVGHPFDSDTSVSFEAHTVAARTLRSLSAQRLDHGSLQTLSDPTSDLRVLVVHDDLGRRVSAATMEAPLGIVGTSPPRHELLAVRTPGAADVATYRRHSHTPSSLCRLRSFVRSDSDDGCGTVDR